MLRETNVWRHFRSNRAHCDLTVGAYASIIVKPQGSLVGVGQELYGDL